MTSQIYLKDFDQVYDETYLDVLRFIVCNSININDVNDILQEVYMELFKILKKKNLDNINIKSYVISIAANKIKKYYSLIYKISKISLFTKDEYDHAEEKDGKFYLCLKPDIHYLYNRISDNNNLSEKDLRQLCSNISNTDYLDSWFR